MEGLNQHLQQKYEWEAKLAGAKNGSGGGSSLDSSQSNTGVSGDILGFAGVKKDN